MSFFCSSYKKCCRYRLEYSIFLESRHVEEKAPKIRTDVEEVDDLLLILAKYIEHGGRVSSDKLLDHKDVPQVYRDEPDLAQEFLLQLVLRRMACLELTVGDQYFFVPPGSLPARPPTASTNNQTATPV